MSHRAREDAHRPHRRDDAALRSVSGSAPCGRKESGDDGRRAGCGGRRDRRGGRRSFAVAQSAGQAEKQIVSTEARYNLSRYLDQVKNGESILVLDRRRPMAQIIPLQKAGRGAVKPDDRLARLERKGLIRRGSGGSGQWLAKRRLTKCPGVFCKICLTSAGVAGFGHYSSLDR
jgi:antitoxin (DNA-binding transcriptional repressor) of toxin-antitoxin stability system